jgi:hypothetical protein
MSVMRWFAALSRGRTSASRLLSNDQAGWVSSSELLVTGATLVPVAPIL